MDEAIAFDTCFILEKLQFLILNYELFRRSGQWLELDNYQSEGDSFGLVFTGLPISKTTALGIVTLRPPGRVATEL